MNRFWLLVWRVYDRPSLAGGLLRHANPWLAPRLMGYALRSKPRRMGVDEGEMTWRAST